MKIILSLILGYVLTSILASALTTKPEPKKKEKLEPPKAHVTVIALGAIAKRRFHIPEKIKKNKAGKEIAEKGTPILIPPLEGESPPATLYYREKNDDKEYAKIRIGFNNPASINELKANKQYRLYRRNEKSGSDYNQYITLPMMAENSQALLFLTQKSKRTSRWLNKPITNSINLNSKKLKNARLFMKNISSERVYLRIGDADQVVLKPNEGYVFKGEETQNMIKVLAGKGRSGKVLLIRTGIRIPPENLTTFAFYNADPATNSGKSVGVCRVVTTRLKFSKPEKKQ